jgi:hypothetical protein
MLMLVAQRCKARREAVVYFASEEVERIMGRPVPTRHPLEFVGEAMVSGMVIDYNLRNLMKKIFVKYATYYPYLSAPEYEMARVKLLIALVEQETRYIIPIISSGVIKTKIYPSLLEVID